MTKSSNILAVLDGLADAFNAHDIDKIMSYFDHDCSLDMPRGPEPHGSRYTGLDGVRRGLRARFEATPDVHYGDLEHFVSNDTGMSKWLLTGTTRSGEKIKVRGCDFYTFRKGKEEGSAISMFKFSFPLIYCTGKSALLMSKKFTFKQAF